MIIGPHAFFGIDDVFAGADLLVVNADPVTVTDEQVLMDSGSMQLNTAALADNQYLVRVGIYLEGSSASNALPQVVRGVVYDEVGTLVAAGDPIEVVPQQPEGWVTLTFSADQGVELPTGTYQYGVQAGDVNDEAGFFTTDPDATDTGMLTVTDVPFTDGAPTTLPDGTTTDRPMVAFLETIPTRPLDTDVLTDDYLASLPFDVAQSIFRASAPIPSTAQNATAGWYGTTFDPTTGSNAIVRSDGPLAELVGERLLVTRRTPYGNRQVAVYVSNELAFPDAIGSEDIVLTERAWMALGTPTLDDMAVTVEVLQ